MANVLITGAGGFLGARLTRKLLENGNYVHAVDLLQNPERLAALSTDPLLRYEWKSVQDLMIEDLTKADYVIHLAAQADVPLAISSPEYTWEVNTKSTLGVLQLLRRISSGYKPHLILMASESVYGNAPPPISEDTALNPVGAYGASKAACDIITLSYVRGYKIRATVIRSGTMFGPNSRLKQVIPIFLSQAFRGRNLEVEGGHQTRDFNYVDNVVGGILDVMKAEKELTVGEVFNLGSGEERTISDVARACIIAANQVLKEHGRAASTSQIQIRPARAGEEGGVRLALNVKKARDLLGYKPLVSFNDGLHETARWLYDYLKV